MSMLYEANRTIFKSHPGSIAARLLRRPHLSRRERALLHLRHAHIAPMYLDVQQGAARIATEPMPGPTLADQLAWRRKTPFGVPEVLESLRPVAHALEYAHRQGVAHGHLFPGAIVQMPEGAVVTGFAEQSVRGRTYRAPEANGAATPSGDVYALALIAYEMLTGVLPNSRTPARRLPRGVDRVLARALASNPRDRYHSPLRLLNALETTPEYTSYFAACRARVQRERQNMLIAMFSFLTVLLIMGALAGAIIGTQF